MNLNKKQRKILHWILYCWIILCITLGIILLIVGYYKSFTYVDITGMAQNLNLHDWFNTIFTETGINLNIFSTSIDGVNISNLNSDAWSQIQIAQAGFAFMIIAITFILIAISMPLYKKFKNLK